MPKKVAIVQSNYIPWKGYFDLIAAVDEFILYDDMQYTRRDWRNRNKIKTPHGVQWLTVPVLVKGKYFQKIRETQIRGSEWSLEHWKAFKFNYQRAPHYDEVSELIAPIYANKSFTHISQLNHALIMSICSYLGINTKIANSWDYSLAEGKTERLADLCAQVGATEYISGPAAKDYVQSQVFSERGITLRWFDYDGYTEYPQLWGEFKHDVSILDLLFNCGKNSPRYMKFLA
ncbi:WbqC family protein [Synechococcus sp. FGCU-3]|nr:WbqC family protein [Synechococcus sp. FGCU3]